MSDAFHSQFISSYHSNGNPSDAPDLYYRYNKDVASVYNRKQNNELVSKVKRDDLCNIAHEQELVITHVLDAMFKREPILIIVTTTNTTDSVSKPCIYVFWHDIFKQTTSMIHFDLPMVGGVSLLALTSHPLTLVKKSYREIAKEEHLRHLLVFGKTDQSVQVAVIHYTQGNRRVRGLVTQAELPSQASGDITAIHILTQDMKDQRLGFNDPRILVGTSCGHIQVLRFQALFKQQSKSGIHILSAQTLTEFSGQHQEPITYLTCERVPGNRKIIAAVGQKSKSTTSPTHFDDDDDDQDNNENAHLHVIEWYGNNRRRISERLKPSKLSTYSVSSTRIIPTETGFQITTIFQSIEDKHRFEVDVWSVEDSKPTRLLSDEIVESDAKDNIEDMWPIQGTPRYMLLYPEKIIESTSTSIDEDSSTEIQSLSPKPTDKDSIPHSETTQHLNEMDNSSNLSSSEQMGDVLEKNEDKPPHANEQVLTDATFDQADEQQDNSGSTSNDDTKTTYIQDNHQPTPYIPEATETAVTSTINNELEEDIITTTTTLVNNNESEADDLENNDNEVDVLQQRDTVIMDYDATTMTSHVGLETNENSVFNEMDNEIEADELENDDKIVEVLQQRDTVMMEYDATTITSHVGLETNENSVLNELNNETEADELENDDKIVEVLQQRDTVMMDYNVTTMASHVGLETNNNSVLNEMDNENKENATSQQNDTMSEAMHERHSNDNIAPSPILDNMDNDSKETTTRQQDEETMHESQSDHVDGSTPTLDKLDNNSKDGIDSHQDDTARANKDDTTPEAIHESHNTDISAPTPTLDSLGNDSEDGIDRQHGDTAQAPKDDEASDTTYESQSNDISAPTPTLDNLDNDSKDGINSQHSDIAGANKDNITPEAMHESQINDNSAFTPTLDSLGNDSEDGIDSQHGDTAQAPKDDEASDTTYESQSNDISAPTPTLDNLDNDSKDGINSQHSDTAGANKGDITPEAMHESQINDNSASTPTLENLDNDSKDGNDSQHGDTAQTPKDDEASDTTYESQSNDIGATTLTLDKLNNDSKDEVDYQPDQTTINPQSMIFTDMVRENSGIVSPKSATDDDQHSNTQIEVTPIDNSALEDDITSRDPSLIQNPIATDDEVDLSSIKESDSDYEPLIFDDDACNNSSIIDQISIVDPVDSVTPVSPDLSSLASCQEDIAEEIPTPKMIYEAKVKQVADISLFDGLNMVRNDQATDFDQQERLHIFFDIMFASSTTATSPAFLDIDRAIKTLEDLSLSDVEEDWLMGYCFNNKEHPLLKLFIMRYNIKHKRYRLVMMQHQTMCTEKVDQADGNDSKAALVDRINRSCNNLAKLCRKIEPVILQDLPLEVFARPRGKVGNPFLNLQDSTLLKKRRLGFGTEILAHFLDRKRRRIL